jgi:hypothetical protein
VPGEPGKPFRAGVGGRVDRHVRADDDYQSGGRGLLFALAYAGFFAIMGRSAWWVGALLGALQAVFIATVVVNELLPVVHPRMATFNTSANEFALIEPPGFLMRNYGRNTFLVTLAAHVAYGAIIGALVSV